MTSLLAALALAATAAPPPSPSPPGGATVVVFRNAELPAEEGRLIDALRIYTRDVDCRVVVAGKAPGALDTTSDPATLDLVVRQVRAEGAELATWVGRREGGRLTYFLLSVRDRDVRMTEIAALGPDHAAQEVGLKVRTLLSWRPPPPEAPPADGPAPEATPAPAPAPEATPPAARMPARETAPPRVSAAAVPTGSAPGDRLELRAGYVLAVPVAPSPAWLRHGVVLSAELRIEPGALVLFADWAFTTTAQAASQGFAVTLSDIPFGAGVQRWWRISRLDVATGVRAGVHVFDASAASQDGRGGSSRRFAGAAGGVLRVEARLGWRVKAYGGLSAEVLVPAQKFTLMGEAAIETGRFLVGGTAGLVFVFL